MLIPFFTISGHAATLSVGLLKPVDPVCLVPSNFSPKAVTLAGEVCLTVKTRQRQEEGQQPHVAERHAERRWECQVFGQTVRMAVRF